MSDSRRPQGYWLTIDTVQKSLSLLGKANVKCEVRTTMKALESQKDQQWGDIKYSPMPYKDVPVSTDHIATRLGVWL
jgi:hypothetical protein